MQSKSNTKNSIVKTFIKYLFACIGSSLIVSVYSIVDCIMVGQYEGEIGTAALAIVLPVWTVILSTGLLFGVGGSILISNNRGKGDEKTANEFFTSTVIFAGIVTLIIWLAFLFFDAQILSVFGANEIILPKARGYMLYLKFAIPLFTFGQILAAFLRNDNAPVKAMIAIMTGGVINIVGDYLFVFVADMGIEGASLATALGQVFAFCIMLSHFFTKKCRLKFTVPHNAFRKLRDILAMGLPSFILDVSVGIISIVINNRVQVLFDAQLTTPILAICGVISNIVVLAQSVSYGIGHAAQPLLSFSHGKEDYSTISKLFKCGIIAALIWAAVAAFITIAFPVPIVMAFMKTTPEVVRLTPFIFRIYCSALAILPLTIFIAEYLQALTKYRVSILISVLRGDVLPLIFIFTLPLMFGSDALWFSVPLAEVIMLIVAILIKRFTRINNSALKA